MDKLIGVNLILYVLIFIGIIWYEDLTIKGCIRMWILCCVLLAFLTTGVYLIFF